VRGLAGAKVVNGCNDNEASGEGLGSWVFGPGVCRHEVEREGALIAIMAAKT
jgi:hypothetical protein